jgi:hypothetical protein
MKMKRQIRFSGLIGIALIVALALGSLALPIRTAATADEPGVQGVASQIKQLQQQLAELQKHVNDVAKPRIVAAGTVTYNRPPNQDNTTFSPVKLSPEIAAKLGEDYVVLLTNRYPTGGYPFFGVYWKRAAEGFDIYLVDIEISDGTTASYANPNTKYLIDWAVVRK